jgi:hypothetical protein
MKCFSTLFFTLLAFVAFTVVKADQAGSIVFKTPEGFTDEVRETVNLDEDVGRKGFMDHMAGLGGGSAQVVEEAGDHATRKLRRAAISERDLAPGCPSPALSCLSCKNQYGLNWCRVCGNCL